MRTRKSGVATHLPASSTKKRSPAGLVVTGRNFWKTSKGNYLPDVHLHLRKQVSNLCKQGIRQRARECPETARRVRPLPARRSAASGPPPRCPKTAPGTDTSTVRRNSRRPPRIQRHYPSRATIRRGTPSGIQLQPHSLATTRPIH